MAVEVQATSGQGLATQRVAPIYRSLCNCGRPGVKPDAGSCCVTTTDTPIERPDLAIYSQIEQLANGAMPSWDSPDIVTNHWAPFRLMEEAQVTVRNLSPTTAAANAIVHYYTSPFGIGPRRQLRLSQMVSLAPGQQATLLFPLHQEVLSGDPRTAVHIEIEHPYDPNKINNSGSQVHDGGFTSESGRSFDVRVPVFNDSGESRQIDLSVLPTELSASLTPTSHVFAPFEQILATLHIDVPAFLTGTPASPVQKGVTIVGRLAATGALIGGATRLVRIDS